MAEFKLLPDNLSAEAAQAAAFWTSLWPIAPMFGVEWRYAPLFPYVNDAMRAFAPKPEPEAAEAETPLPAEPEPSVEAAPAVTPAAAEPAESAPAPAPVAAEPAPVDDLTRIKGIGPKLAEQLNALGIQNFGQIAGLSEAELGKIDDQLDGPNGNCFRNDWIGQAKALTA